MQTLSSDTPPDAEEIQLELLRDMPAWRKLELMEEMTRTVFCLVLAGLRERHPQATKEELRLRVATLVLGPDLAARAYGRAVELDDGDLLERALAEAGTG
jgi:hypothetical protein